MAKLRTVVVTMPPLLRDIVTAIVAEQTSLEILADLDSREGIGPLLELLAPALVLVGLHPGEVDDVGKGVLAQVPAAKVIVIASDGRDAFVHEMDAGRRALRHVSAEALAEAISGAAPKI